MKWTATILLALACAFARADYGPGTTDSDLLRSGTPVVTNAWLAVSNETARLVSQFAGDASRITDGTNTIDAAGNVYGYVIASIETNYWNSTLGVLGLEIWEESDGQAVYASWTNQSAQIYWMSTSWGCTTNGYYIGEVVGTPYDSSVTFGTLTFFRQLATNTTLRIVGKLALTNDIPSVVDADLTPATNYANAAVASLAQTGTVWRALSVGTTNYWQDATGCVWEVEDSIGGWMSTTSAVHFTSWDEVDTEFDLWKIYFNVDGAGANGYAYNPTGYTNYTLVAGAWQYDETDVYGDFDVTFVRQTIPCGLTNLVGRVALTNDIPDVSGYATQQQATNAATAVADAKISTNNAAFVSAVTNCPVVIASGGGGGDGFPAGDWSDYGTLGALLAAIVAAITWLKNNQRYALHTVTLTNGAGTLLDRAGNRVVLSGDTTLTLPAAVPGYLRDFLVRLEISGSTVPTITFAAPTGETIIYETDGDDFPVPDEAGTWLYSFTESCVAHKFAVSLKKVNEVAQGGS